MAKINLLKEKKISEKGPSGVPSEAKPIQAILIIAVLLIVGIGFIAWYWVTLNNKYNMAKEKYESLEKEAQNLRHIKEMAQKYKKLKDLLQQRKDIIENLKNSQSGPVEMMNAFVKSLPAENPKLWFSSLDESRTGDGENVVVDGVALDVYAFLDFVSALQKTGYFDDVSMVYYNKNSSKKDKTQLTKFEISCTKKIKKSIDEGK